MEAPGSSPLARGTLLLPTKTIYGYGLIPARAGNTSPAQARARVLRAHPRSRGEHLSTGHTAPTWWGSSPLARGTLVLWLALAAVSGLIPARAGNTLPTSTLARTGGAHPRSRGEHASTGSTRDSTAGSSPLARGTLPRESPGHRRKGLIPARAGNTHEDR